MIYADSGSSTKPTTITSTTTTTTTVKQKDAENDYKESTVLLFKEYETN